MADVAVGDTAQSIVKYAIIGGVGFMIYKVLTAKTSKASSWVSDLTGKASSTHTSAGDLVSDVWSDIGKEDYGNAAKDAAALGIKLAPGPWGHLMQAFDSSNSTSDRVFEAGMSVVTAGIPFLGWADGWIKGESYFDSALQRDCAKLLHDNPNIELELNRPRDAQWYSTLLKITPCFAKDPYFEDFKQNYNAVSGSGDNLSDGFPRVVDNMYRKGMPENWTYDDIAKRASTILDMEALLDPTKRNGLMAARYTPKVMDKVDTIREKLSFLPFVDSPDRKGKWFI